MSRIRTIIALLGLPLLAAQAQKPAAATSAGGQKPAPQNAAKMKPAVALAPLPFEVTEASVADLQRALIANRVTSEQLVDAYLARIAAYDHAGPSINAMLRLNSRARAEAAEQIPAFAQ